MLIRSVCRLATCILVVPLLAACDSASDVAGGGGDGGASSNISEALAQVPPDAESVSITDWEALRQDFPGLAEQDGGFSPVMAKIPSVSQIGRYATYMDDEFGWSVLDSTWEMRWTGSPDADVPVGPISMKLPDTVDLDVFQTTLEEDGFAGQEVGSGTLWSIDLSDATTPIPITTWWVDESAHLVKASISPDADSMTVPGDPSDELLDLAEEVGDASVVQLSVGQLTCFAVDPVWMYDGDADDMRERLQEQIEQYSDLSKPRARAESWSGSADEGASELTSSTGTVVMLYESDDSAKTDHERRLDLLKNGMSYVSARPYADTYSVTDDSVSGDVSRFTIGKGAERIFDAVYSHDWPFAVCPS